MTTIDRPHAAASGALAGPFMMFISAAIFGYFGFGSSWVHKMTTDDPPQLLIMVAVLEWTLKASAVAFLLAGLITTKRALEGNLLYSAIGVAGSVLFVAVAIWDFTSVYFSGISPILLLIFAAWNGYGAWTGLQGAMAARAMTRPDPMSRQFDPPTGSTSA